MTIKILAVGKPTPPAYREMQLAYEKRLSPYHRIDWHFIAASAYPEPSAAKAEETTRILKAIDKTHYVIVLDERGVEYTNIQLEKHFARWLTARGTLVFVIGGAYGVAPLLFDRADATLSLSKLVFPHLLVRVLLLEQLYRSQMINIGHPYHHS